MAELIQIGNSKGVRIPKVLIEQAGLEGRVLELKVVREGTAYPTRQAAPSGLGRGGQGCRSAWRSRL